MQAMMPTRVEKGDADLGARARVIHYLRKRIDDGTLVAGQPLPSGRELSRRLQVNPRTVRSALETLSQEGFIRPSGPRLHIVSARNGGAAPAAPTAAVRPLSLMRDAVLVLSNEPYNADDPTNDAAEMGAIQESRAHRLNVFALHPQNLGEATLERLRNDPPLGAVISELFATGLSSRLAAQLHGAGVPVVVYGDAPGMAGFDRVTSDHEEGAYRLTLFLLERGCVRPRNLWVVEAAVIDGKAPLEYWLPERRAGYERAMREAGREPLPEILVAASPYGESDPAIFERTARHFLGYMAEHLAAPESARPDALLIDTDWHLPLIAAACRLLGREPNRDIALVGYDNTWHQTPLRLVEPVPPLATVDKRLFEIGREMTNLLVERVRGTLPAAAGPHLRRVAPEMLTREPG
jgi:DNA-binding LacI/PurR family transcriptional regulator